MLEVRAALRRMLPSESCSVKSFWLQIGVFQRRLGDQERNLKPRKERQELTCTAGCSKQPEKDEAVAAEA